MAKEQVKIYLDDEARQMLSDLTLIFKSGGDAVTEALKRLHADLIGKDVEQLRQLTEDRELLIDRIKKKIGSN